MRKSGHGLNLQRPAWARLRTAGGEHERECDGAHALKDAALHDLIIAQVSLVLYDTA